MSLRCQSDQIPAGIFRAYDIRGVVDTDLTPDVAHDVAKAYAAEVLAIGSKTVVVGRDARLSGPGLMAAFQEGLLSSGCDIVDIGIVPSPLMYYATHHLNIDCGIMITGSHNPPEYNGIKMILGGKSLSGNKVQDLYLRLQRGDVIQGQGSRHEDDVQQAYIDEVSKAVPLVKPMKVVVDAGNGVAGEVAPALLRAMGCDVVELFCEIDGRFPNHHPDPSRPENMKDLIAAVKQHKADIGVAFDGDADRLGVVTPKGKMIYPDRQIMLFAKHVLKNHSGGKVVFDVKCSKYLANVISEAGGEPILYKTGHSLLKAKLFECGAVLAGEMSGHIFFHDVWYGFDDGIYSAARLLQILAADERGADSIFDELPDSVSTPELMVAVSDERKFDLCDELQRDADFPSAEVITIDGLRVEFPDGWGLIRASNTTPMLTMRYEADTPEALWRIQVLMRDYLLEHEPGLDVPMYTGE